MEKTAVTYSLFTKMAALFFGVALLWLTVSIYFTSNPAYKKQLIEWNADVEDTDFAPEEDADSRNTNTEEKAPKSNGAISEEIFHESQFENKLFTTLAPKHVMVNYSTYLAFHGEMDVPPPDELG
ncbi:MAG: hypothetical protein RIR12_1690 [Bacteroidota bacterium]|jgi:hypothetical protein